LSDHKQRGNERATGPRQSDFGVIFDMDGVLVDSAEPHWRSWQLLAEENGKTLTKEVFAATFGRQNKDIIPMIFGPASLERITALADRKETIYRDLIREQPPIVSGAVALVRELHCAGIPMAVGSSGPPANIQLVLAAMGVADIITIIVSSLDVTRGKPDPLVFSLACERLGLPPGRCVVVEDAPVGIEAAKAAGAKAVAILLHHPRSAFTHADVIVDQLAHIDLPMLRRCIS